MLATANHKSFVWHMNNYELIPKAIITQGSSVYQKYDSSTHILTSLLTLLSGMSFLYPCSFSNNFPSFKSFSVTLLAYRPHYPTLLAQMALITLFNSPIWYCVLIFHMYLSNHPIKACPILLLYSHSI